MNADPRRLAVLLAVHRAGGVLAAADVLRVTPSAVSQQIARLEGEVGVAVLVRGPRGVSLTPAGRVLAEAAERIEAELVEARKAVAALDEDLTGRVRVGAFQTAIRAVVAPVAAQLATSLPGVELDVEEHELAELLRLQRAGDLDLVLLEQDTAEGPPAELRRGTRDVVLLDEPWRVVVPAAMPVPARLAELSDAVWLGAAAETAAARALGRVSRALGAPLTTRHVYSDFGVALALVAAGLGVALLPALALPGPAGAPGSSGRPGGTRSAPGAPDGVTVVRLPGLGTRRLVLRHRSTRHEPRPVVRAVMAAMTQVAAQVDFG